MRRKNWMRHVVIWVLSVLLAVCSVFPAMAEDAVGNTIRLSRTEGTVTVSRGDGRSVTMLPGMKLNYGYWVKTWPSSYSWITLDDTKMIKMDEVSETEVRQSGKSLEVTLHSGKLFFQVTKPLEQEESLEIRTSTMVCGIRGTSGWVEAIDSRHSRVNILDGRVECTVTDPVSKETRSITLEAGQTADLQVHAMGQPGEKCSITVSPFYEERIPGFVSVEVANNTAYAEMLSGYFANGIGREWFVEDMSRGCEEKLLTEQKTAAKLRSRNKTSRENRSPVANRIDTVLETEASEETQPTPTEPEGTDSTESSKEESSPDSGASSEEKNPDGVNA